MDYSDIDDVIAADGLRIVLLRGYPSPWGQAAKGMMEYKGLDFMAGALAAGGVIEAVVAWSGVNSAPVVAWNDEPPVDRWNDILLLLERLVPDRPLMPTASADRVHCFGLAHEICGELGFGWNRRLAGVHGRVEAGAAPGVMGDKYGYNAIDGALAEARGIAFMEYLTGILKAQAKRGSGYIFGERVTALDFYWAAFSNLARIQSPEDCPLDPAIRPIFEQVTPAVAAAVDPILIEHRGRIMRTYFKLPMEL